eukprot:TRINITY_DN14330_c0_g1_i1.p1 TRINITY_DN14330_c0_g1~~TRINITY_DN14330_c0_g1_i1.p1  ORF type:complete len:235 (+),score=40.23 TRINITY_DN14330_c0_g1_i1:114-818(+)
MLQEVLARATAYVEQAVFGNRCCCTSDPRDDPHGKCGDVVVFADWHEDGLGLQGDALKGFSEPQVPAPAAARGVAGERPPGQAASMAIGPCSTAGLGAGCHAHDLDLMVEEDPDAEVVELREKMKTFVQDLLRGRAYLVVVEKGRTEPSKLMLTANLQYLQLEVAGTTHDIPLRNVKDICPGKSLENRFTPVSLDDLCSTLVLKNGECVTFRLSSLQERDEFTKCLKVLSIALD